MGAGLWQNREAGQQQEPWCSSLSCFSGSARLRVRLLPEWGKDPLGLSLAVCTQRITLGPLTMPLLGHSFGSHCVPSLPCQQRTPSVAQKDGASAPVWALVFSRCRGVSLPAAGHTLGLRGQVLQPLVLKGTNLHSPHFAIPIPYRAGQPVALSLSLCCTKLGDNEAATF